jgi:hypothetical protein
MKKILTLAAALLVVASASMAQGLNLSFGNCGPAGTTTVVVNCNSNAGALLVINASMYPAAPMGTFAAATAIIDCRAGGLGGLPAWWQTRAGQCRANSVGMSFDPNNNVTDCADIWAGNPNLQVTDIQQGLNGPDHVRFIGVAAIPAGSEIAVAPGAELWVCRLTINKANTLTCAGCALPSSLVFNEAYLQDPNEPAQKVTNPADNYCVGLSGGAASCPGATPATNRTWGAVKNLYR